VRGETGVGVPVGFDRTTWACQSELGRLRSRLHGLLIERPNSLYPTFQPQTILIDLKRCHPLEDSCQRHPGRPARLRVRDGPLSRCPSGGKAERIDLTPKYIPPEVFDKRAVDKGQVVFFDIAFVEATPRYDSKNKFTLKIELTDFSVYYSQGQAEDLIKGLKEGKNGVLCEQGQLVKVIKDKDGVVTREVLTKKWTDWVDY
jgi:hypothetical protein